MLKNIKNKFMYVCAFIVGLMLIFILFTGNSGTKKDKSIVKLEDITSLFDKITNNYTLNIIENSNGLNTEYIYYNDSNIELYEKDDSTVGFIKYKDKYFSLKEDATGLKKVDKIDFISDEYYDINFIKVLINESTFERESNYKVSTKINMVDYAYKYNNYYSRSFDIPFKEDDFIKITFIYNSNIESIIMDYPSNLSYSMSFSDINNTDFSIVVENFKDELE